MKTKLLLGFSLAIMALQVHSQSIKENIESQHKDPSRIENAAKADVYLHKKKITSDSNYVKSNSPTVATKQKRKKICKKP